MADNRNQAEQPGKSGNGKNRSNDNGNGGDKTKKESFKDRKMRLAQESTWNVISQKTTDTAEYVNLLNANDYLIYQLRMTNFERNPNLSYDDLREFMRRNNEIKELINLLNIDLSKALGRDYRPPRGYSAQPTPKQNKKAGSEIGEGVEPALAQ